MRIQTGYGLEGALPDITCNEIIRDAVAPRFRAKDYEGGFAAGIDLIFKAIRGEYKGTGKTVRESGTSQNSSNGGLLVFFFVLIMILLAMRASRRFGGYRYTGARWPIHLRQWGGGWSGGSGGGWSSGGGFSGFSGGGGSSGGGGARRQLVTRCEHSNFLRRLDHNRIIKAIKKAEAENFGPNPCFTFNGGNLKRMPCRVRRKIFSAGHAENARSQRGADFCGPARA